MSEPICAACEGTEICEACEGPNLTRGLRMLQDAIEDMDRRMSEGAGVDEDGWIIGYRLPTGPWARVIAASRGIFRTPAPPDLPPNQIARPSI